jgi:uncharacterized protein YndB with AHSA1/START domain
MDASDKQIQKIRVIESPVDKIWWKWSTHEGLLTFFGYDNKIELEPGGQYEIYFNEENPEGLKGSEGCKIVSFEPNNYITFTWNSPPQFSDARKSIHKTLVEVKFTPLDENKTEISLTHSQWPDDPHWDDVFDYFEIAWDIVLNKLEMDK